MQDGLLFGSAQGIILVIGGGATMCAVFLAYRVWRISRVTPEERERRRRAALVAHGKMGDATLTDLRGDFLFYSYAVRGVEYTASQDLSLLKEYLPPNFSALAGAISVRYDPKIPANSIVLAESWSGLRTYAIPNRKPTVHDAQAIGEKAGKPAPQQPA